ncbi:MAG: preprotein translocase subunit SecE [Firmicutes bacterium]|nr:preprotein translocase subunit SecE [Bacillota bacterium]
MSDKSTKKKDDKKLAKDTKGKKDVKKSAAKDSSKKSLNPIKSVGKFVREYKSEIKKISWPTVKDTTKNTAITLAAILVVGVFIWALDFGLSSLRDLAFEKIPEWSIFSDDVSDSDVDVSDSDSAK